MMHIIPVDRIAHLIHAGKHFPLNVLFVTFLNSLSCQLLPILLHQKQKVFLSSSSDLDLKESHKILMVQKCFRDQKAITEYKKAVLSLWSFSSFIIIFSCW